MKTCYLNIPTKKVVQDFKSYLEEYERIIFSAKFGEGKTYFLSDFMEAMKDKYIFIPIYPINYQVADNKDVFEYIKHDILIRLLMRDDMNFDRVSFSKSQVLYKYLVDNKLPVMLNLLEMLPSITIGAVNINLSKGISNFYNIKKNFDLYKKKISPKSQINQYLNEYEELKGSIYELDIISQLICDINDGYREQTGKEVVLVIEDLDRIDPAQIFRILNIFSAHFDWINVSAIEFDFVEYSNKFKFDKVITVCDYNNIKSIYHHCYGVKTDFRGYMSKFSCGTPFYYSIKTGVVDFIVQNINNIYHEFIIFDDVIMAIANIIYKKCLADDDSFVNMRELSSQMAALVRVKEFTVYANNSIKVTDELFVKIENKLVKFFILLSKFNIAYNTFRKTINGDCLAMLSLYKLIGECWLIAVAKNSVIKSESTSCLTIRKKNTTNAIGYLAKVENNYITYFDIDEYYSRNPQIFQEEDFIIRKFANYVPKFRIDEN